MYNSSSGPQLLLDCSLRDYKPSVCRRRNPHVEDSSVPFRKRPLQMQIPKPQAPDTTVTSMASESQRVYDENLSQFPTAAPLHLGGHPPLPGLHTVIMADAATRTSRGLQANSCGDAKQEELSEMPPSRMTNQAFTAGRVNRNAALNDDQERP